MIQKMNLTNQIDKAKAKEIFEELDTEKKGNVDKQKFIDYITHNHPHEDSAIKNFVESVNEQLYSKSEKIIVKLKKLKEKEYLQKDMQALNDLDWYIVYLTEGS